MQYDEQLVFEISKIIALNDSVGESWAYNKSYTMKSFKEDLNNKQEQPILRNNQTSNFNTTYPQIAIEILNKIQKLNTDRSKQQKSQNRKTANSQIRSPHKHKL